MKNNNEILSGNSKRIISIVDYGRIMSKLENDLNYDVLPELLHRLYLILKRARIIPWEQVPSDLITMNSRLLLKDLNTLKTRIVRLSYDEKNETNEEISIYHPLALACLGQREKSVISCFENNQAQIFQVEKILFQPEEKGLITM